MRPSWVEGKHVLLGITGGIAAYKTCDLARGYIKAGCEVEVIMTDMAAELVSPLSMATLTHNRVWRDKDFSSPDLGYKIPHITLTDWADVFVVAPCTANTLRAAATADASTLLGAAMTAWGKRPLLFFPAMNVHMLENPATVENIRILRERGHVVIDPDEGFLACGYSGRGRLPETGAILDETWAMLSPDRSLEGKRIMITAGPTLEYIDPVRFFSNPSTGKMGYALAAMARCRGAEVVLVSGPVNLRAPSGVEVIKVTTAEQMLDACLSNLDRADAVIKAAAVGDYRSPVMLEHKIKRERAATMTLELVSNPDIAAEISKRKRPDQVLVGFAAETDDIIGNAMHKIEKKGLDMVVANDVLAKDAGFAVDTNRVSIVMAPRYGESGVTCCEGQKIDVAGGILDALQKIFAAKQS